jgi:protein-disulfide isomerase
VKVVVYADFGCPLCSVASPALRRLSQEEPDLIAYYFKNYPLKSNPEAVPAALALLAADRQGKFWEMHDLLYEKEKDELCDETYESCAESIGLDLDKFRADMKDPDLIKRLRAEKTEGIKCGVEKTPGLLFNGKPYGGVKTPLELLDRIEEEMDLLDSEK